MGSEVDYWEQLHESESELGSEVDDCEPPPFVTEAGEALDLAGLYA